MNPTSKSIPIRKVLVAAGALATAALVARVVQTRVAAATIERGGRSDRGAAGTDSNAGRQRRWAVTLETRIKQPGAATDRDNTIVLTGDLVSTLSGESAAGSDVAYELQNAHASGTGFGEVNPADVAELEHHLAQRFWVTYQPDGAAARVHFPRDMTDDVRNFLELVATQAQLVRPAEASPQWTTTERDAAGTYFAAYEGLGPGEILKRKMRYMTLDGTSGPHDSSVAVRVDSSETRFAVDGQGLVDSVQGHEATYVEAKLGALGLSVDIRLRMDHPRSGRDPGLVGSFERARPGLDSGPIVTQRATDQEMLARRDARLVYGLTLEQVLDSLRSGHADEKVRAQVEALLRQRPKDIPAAMAFAREAGKDASTLVLQAAGAAGTPATQDALCVLASDERAPGPLRIESVGALVRTKEPTAPTIATLIRLMDAGDAGLRRQALYMAGTAGANCEDGDPQALARIQAELLARHASCNGPTCVDVLAALGNLGTPAIVPSVERSLGDGSAAVRAAAARALRRVKIPAADGLIARAMKDDADPSVRAAAVFASTFRPLSPLLEALSHTIEADPVDYVRTAAIEAVANHIDESPLVEKALVTAAAKDSVAGVRRLAREALGPRAPN